MFLIKRHYCIGVYLDEIDSFGDLQRVYVEELQKKFSKINIRSLLDIMKIQRIIKESSTFGDGRVLSVVYISLLQG